MISPYSFFLFQIPRSDPCEICVCVDSEMYCLWKLCPSHHQTTTSPSQGTTTNNLNKQPTTKQSTNDNKTTMVQNNINNNITDADIKSNEIDVTNEKYTKILTDQRKYNALKKLEVTSPNNMVSPIKATGASTTSTTTTTEKAVTFPSEPTVCWVMGKHFNDILRSIKSEGVFGPK